MLCHMDTIETSQHLAMYIQNNRSADGTEAYISNMLPSTIVSTRLDFDLDVMYVPIENVLKMS